MKLRKKNLRNAIHGIWKIQDGEKYLVTCATEVFFYKYNFLLFFLQNNYLIIGVDMGPIRISCDENKILKDIEDDVKEKFEN
jgi:hypothetical protein